MVVAQQAAPKAKPSAPVVVETHGTHAASVLSALSNDLQTLSHAVEPAVVKIYATGLARFRTSRARRRSSRNSACWGPAPLWIRMATFLPMRTWWNMRDR